MLKSALLGKLTLAAIAAAAAAACIAGPASANVIHNDVTVAPPFHDGRCPFTFKFTANIESNSGGIVKYRWIRSDGAMAPVEELDFRGPGTRTVTTTWELSPPHFKGWEAVRILAPNGGVSNHAEIELTCH